VGEGPGVEVGSEAVAVTGMGVGEGVGDGGLRVGVAEGGRAVAATVRLGEGLGVGEGVAVGSGCVGAHALPRMTRTNRMGRILFIPPLYHRWLTFPFDRTIISALSSNVVLLNGTQIKTDERRKPSSSGAVS
jgi:hypothetical protein